MYNTIIEKTKPYVGKLLDDYMDDLIFAYNLHSKAKQEYCGYDASDTTAFLWHFGIKEDVKQAIDEMSIDTFYSMVKKTTSKDFFFDREGHILTSDFIREKLQSEYSYYMFEALAEPWLNEKTQRLYKVVWDIAEYNKKTM